MDLRLRDFAKRTLHRLCPWWTSGAPNRPNKPRRDPSDSPGHSNIALRAGIQKCAASVDPVESDVLAAGPDNTIADLDFNSATLARESLPVSERIFERPGEQDEDLEDLHGTATYTDGPSRVILANDGTKECLALLLSHDIVEKLNQLRTLDRKVKTLQCRFDDADGDAVVAQAFLDQSEELITTSRNVEDQDRIRKQMVGACERLQEASKRRERIKDPLDTQKRNRAFSRNDWQEMFERVLLQAGLLEAIKEEDSMRRGSETSIAQSVEQSSEAGSDASNGTVISLDQLNRMATYEKVQATEEWLHAVQDKFDTRRQTYDNEWHEYRQAVEDGTCSLSQSEFDRIDLFNVRHQTSLLINAEAAHEQAKAQARALGILGNDLDQESDFIDQEDDGGYLESLDAELLAGVDRDYIEGWCTEIDGHEDQETLQRQFTDAWDEWDAKTVDISDSISLVDRGRNRKRIDRWRESCEL